MDVHTDLRRKSALITKLRAALLHPSRILPHWRRVLRNRRLKAHSKSHTEFYRGVMRDDATRNPYGAIGSDSQEHWIKVGQIQFDYLVTHGLQPVHRVLDIGSGNLRAGWRLIQYLNPGNYYGVDISPEILLAALRQLSDRQLQHKSPYLVLVNDLRFEFLPDESFDVIHAHSVFTHSPVDVIDQCFASVTRILKPDGFFDFTYLKGERMSYLDEDFSYPTQMLVDMAAAHRLLATPMADWDRSQPEQQKLRLRRQPAAVAADA